MALNILVGHTGLVSFGHGAWFGLGAYAAALAQRHWFPGSVLWPALLRVGVPRRRRRSPIGFLVLRRRGVYFSLLTLAFSALTYAIAFRWTAFTGGENGLGGVTRADWLGVDLDESAGSTTRWSRDRSRSSCMRAVALPRIADRHACCSRFARTSSARSSSAMRRSATSRSPTCVSATLTGFAGVLFAFHHRFASADPTAISFSGELLAMVIIGGMRSLLGPALGALFYILFREYLSIWTPNWLLFFGLLFVGFIVFSPTGLVGVWRRLTEPLRPKVVEAAAMAGRARSSTACRCRRSCRRDARSAAPCCRPRGLAKAFGGIHAVAGREHRRSRDRTLHALIGPNGAGKTTVFNLISGHVRARSRPRDRSLGGDIDRQPPHAIVAAGLAARSRSPICFRALTVAGESAARRAGARRQPLQRLDARDAIEPVIAETAELVRFSGCRASSAPRPASCRTAGSGCSTWGWRSRRAPRVLLLDEPLAGLAAAERERVAALIKRISARHSGAAGRARHRPRVRAGRPRDRHERGPGAGRRHR